MKITIIFLTIGLIVFILFEILMKFRFYKARESSVKLKAEVVKYKKENTYFTVAYNNNTLEKIENESSIKWVNGDCPTCDKFPDYSFIMLDQYEDPSLVPGFSFSEDTTESDIPVTNKQFIELCKQAKPKEQNHG
jgi:hypothetical protein